jgi:Uma2 family endonuclease
MTTKTQDRLMTAEEFMATPDDKRGVKYELVKGRRMQVSEPPMPEHGNRIGRIFSLLVPYLDANPIAHFSGESGVTLKRGPDTVRVPDIFVTRYTRLPRGYRRGPIEVGPDLVIEVRSPSERPGMLQDKMRDYFAAGTTLFWVVDQDERTVTIHRPNAPPHVVAGDERLTGDPVLPGFSCTLDELFR